MVISCSTCQMEEKECILVKYVICAVLPRFQFCRYLRNFSVSYFSEFTKKMLFATMRVGCTIQTNNYATLPANCQNI